MELTDGYFSPFWRRLPYGDPGPDPTGLVKGWAAQQASDVLVAHGLPDHVVNAAGDVVVSGQLGPGRPRSARGASGSVTRTAPRALAGVVDLDQSASRWAVATSGTAELGAHVSDPHSGRFPRSVVVGHRRRPPRRHRRGQRRSRTPAPPLWSRRATGLRRCSRSWRRAGSRRCSSRATGPCATRDSCSSQCPERSKRPPRTLLKSGQPPSRGTTPCPTPSPDSRSTRCWCTPRW